MVLLDTIYYLLLSVSVAYMYSFSDIFNYVRNKVATIPYIRVPMSCPECSSFWFGFGVSFIYNPIQVDITCIGLTNIICGLVTHLVASCLYRNNILK